MHARYLFTLILNIEITPKKFENCPESQCDIWFLHNLSSLKFITLSGMGVLGAFPKSKIELLSGHFGLDSVCYSNKMDIQHCKYL